MWPFDQNNIPVYQQYAQSYMNGNYDGLNPNDAIGHLQQFFMGAPLDMQQQLYQQHFAQMPYEQRVFLSQQVPPQYAMNPNDPFSMAQSFLRLGREQPGLLQRILSHPFLLGGTLALAGLVAHHMLSHHQQMYNDPQYGYNPGGYQQQYLQQEVNQERMREQELRRELRSEERQMERMERREERMEEREWHHRHERDYY